VTVGPLRTCIGCRHVRSRGLLVRLVRAGDGRVVFDERGRAPGRGAYVCRDAGCMQQALRAGRLGHAFKRPSEPPESGTAVILDGLVVYDKARR
jgi:predicted RNA-binding protein YlxR (DUF448 family)